MESRQANLSQQIYYVKALPEAPLQNLDLIRAEDEQFSPDKLRATLERFYTTIVVALASFVKHIARLRSWKETRRTSAFCAVGLGSDNSSVRQLIHAGILRRLASGSPRPDIPLLSPGIGNLSPMQSQAFPACTYRAG